LNTKVASIDFGTNTARLLIAEVREGDNPEQILIERESRGVVQPDTGSVTMKKAPSIAPPDSRWNSGLANWSGFHSQSAAAGSAIPPMKASGACQPMTLRCPSQSPPSR